VKGCHILQISRLGDPEFKLQVSCELGKVTLIGAKGLGRPILFIEPRIEEFPDPSL
jgi:hypothetical protein